MTLIICRLRITDSTVVIIIFVCFYSIDSFYVKETRGKCYSEPVTPVVFKNGCDDWYLEYMILMRVINQTMVWKCTCIYNLWMRGCYSNALCPNGHTCERRQWCDKLLLFLLVARTDFGTSSGNAGCCLRLKTLMTEMCLATSVLIWLGVQLRFISSKCYVLMFQ